jgi:hypothetical protein
MALLTRKEAVMPRRRQRKTTWQPQDQRRLRVRAVRLDVPDARKLSRAFIGLALAKAEAETQARAEAEARAAGDTITADATDADPSKPEDGDDHA